MNNPTDTDPRYDPRSIGLHWLTAALVIVLWALGQTIDWFGKGDPRTMARSVHISLGVILGGVLAARLWWRGHGGTRLAPAGTGRLDALAVHMHTLLYVLLVVTVMLGVANAWVRGDALFHLLTIPAFDPDNKSLRTNVEDLHALAANALFILAALHA